MQGCSIVHPTACNALSVLRQDGEWVASEGTYNPETGTLAVLQPRFRSASNILDGDWHGWRVNGTNRGDLPQWSLTLMQCHSRRDQHQSDHGP